MRVENSLCRYGRDTQMLILDNTVISLAEPHIASFANYLAFILLHGD